MSAGVKPVCALTGGNGYVGSAIARALEASGWEVLWLVRRPSSSANEIAWDLGRMADIAGELRARSAQALVHAAWDLPIVNAGDYDRVNRQGSRHLFDAAQSAGVGRIVFVSSISAFDSAISLYGMTKLAVERDLAVMGGISVRPGLVWGERPRGIFGAMRDAVRRSNAVPLIGTGLYPQYLIHEDDLGLAVERVLHNGVTVSAPLTLAHPKMWLFRDLIHACARREAKSVRLIPVPWRMVWLGLKAAEPFGTRLAFRSDSVLSLVHQNPTPDLSGIQKTGVVPRPFEG